MAKSHKATLKSRDYQRPDPQNDPGSIVAKPTPQAPPASAPQANVEPAATLPEATQTAPKAPEPSPSPEAPQTTIEAPPTTPQAPPEKYASQWAKLTAKEEKLQATQRQLKAERDQLKAQQDSIQAERQRYQAIEQAALNAKQNPLALLRSLGLSFQEVQDYALRHLDDVPTPEDARFAKLEEHERKIKAYEQQEAQRRDREQHAQYETEVNRHRVEARSFAQSKADTYKLINLQGAYDDITNTVIENFNQTGQLITIEQASNLVERYLKTEADKLKPYFTSSQQTLQANPSAPANSAVSKTINSTQYGASISEPSKPKFRTRSEKLQYLLAKQRAKRA